MTAFAPRGRTRNTEKDIPAGETPAGTLLWWV